MADIPREVPPDSQPSVSDQIGPDLHAATDALSRTASDIADAGAADAARIRQAAEDQIAEAAEKAKGFADDHKNIAAEQIGGVSAVLTRVADDLAADEKTAPAAGYARTFAENTRRASETLRDSSVEDLVEMAQHFGRRQPLAFLGLAALAGFAAGRFVVASSARANGGSGDASGMYDPDHSNAYGSSARGNVNQDGAPLSNSSDGGAFK